MGGEIELPSRRSAHVSWHAVLAAFAFFCLLMLANCEFSTHDPLDTPATGSSPGVSDITSSGEVIHGSACVISGSGFGSKPSAAPAVFWRGESTDLDGLSLQQDYENIIDVPANTGARRGTRPALGAIRGGFFISAKQPHMVHPVLDHARSRLALGNRRWFRSALDQHQDLPHVAHARTKLEP